VAVICWIVLNTSTDRNQEIESLVVLPPIGPETISRFDPNQVFSDTPRPVTLNLEARIIGKTLQDNGDPIEIVVDKHNHLRTNDLYRIELKSNLPVYLYLFYLDSENQLHCLCLSDECHQAISLRPNKIEVLPSQKRWYTLTTPAGRETIFLAKSADQTRDIMKILEKLNTSITSPGMHSVSCSNAGQTSISQRSCFFAINPAHFNPDELVHLIHSLLGDYFDSVEIVQFLHE
jgi:hypothetical protein